MLVLHPRNKLLCIWIQIALDLENKYIRKKEKKKQIHYSWLWILRSIQPRSLCKKYLRKIQQTGLQLYLTPKTYGRERNVMDCVLAGLELRDQPVYPPKGWDSRHLSPHKASIPYFTNF